MNTYVFKRNLWLPVCSGLLFYETQGRRSLLLCGSDHSCYTRAVVVVVIVVVAVSGRQTDYCACLLIHRPESWPGEPGKHTATWVQRLQLFNKVRLHTMLLRTVKKNRYEVILELR
jgi:hypothetical protein